MHSLFLRRNKLWLSLCLGIGLLGLILSNASMRAESACMRQTDRDDMLDQEVIYTTWSGECVVDTYTYIDTNETLTLAPGTHVLFDGGQLVIMGQLMARGTVAQPIVFDRRREESPAYSLVVSGGEALLRNVTVARGGSRTEAWLMGQSWWPIAPARADVFLSGAIQVDGGRLDAEAVTWRDNVVALKTQHTHAVKVWRSRFIGSRWRDVVATQTDGGGLDLRYNWWGQDTGPAIACETVDNTCRERYVMLEGQVSVGDWAVAADQRDPVLILPGILGSWQWTSQSDFKLDPIFGIYDDLVESLEANGYVRGETLYALPYDWRVSNVTSAQALAEKIQTIRTSRHWPRVDVVAHSMGGLVAREYIQGESYAEDIDQLITLGTPERGAPKAYLMWEAGEFGNQWTDFVMKKVLTLEAEENGYESLFDYIRRGPIPSVRELLPDTSYLREEATGSERAYPEDTPRNTFLEALNTPEGLARLRERVELDAIVGRQSGATTLTHLRVERPSIILLGGTLGRWEYGQPEGYGDLLGDQGLILGAGDGTVPITSARGVTADTTLELEAEHSALPSVAREQVYTLLTAQSPRQKPVSTYGQDGILAFFVHSPVDISVTLPDGQKIGQNFDTGRAYSDIPGAAYTGAETATEFITLRQPASGTYTLQTHGTGTGNWRVEVVSIRPGQTGEAQSQTLDMRGQALPGSEQTQTFILGADQSLTTTPEETRATVLVGVSEGVVNTDDEDDGESRGDHHAKKKSTASVSAAFPMSRTPVNINLATADLSLAPREDTLPGTESLERRQENVPRVAGEEDTDLQDRPLSMFVWLAIVVMSIVAPWGLWRVYKNVLH